MALTVAPAMAIGIIEPEKLSRMMASSCIAVWYCDVLPEEP